MYVQTADKKPPLPQRAMSKDVVTPSFWPWIQNRETLGKTLLPRREQEQELWPDGSGKVMRQGRS